MLKIRRPLGRLIFNMGIAIPGKTVFLIETAPSSLRVSARHARQFWNREEEVLSPDGWYLHMYWFHTLDFCPWFLSCFVWYRLFSICFVICNIKSYVSAEIRCFIWKNCQSWANGIEDVTFNSDNVKYTPIFSIQIRLGSKFWIKHRVYTSSLLSYTTL